MDNIKILGLTYEIERVPYISRDEYRAGEIKYEAQKIKILESLTCEHERQVILHEMFHGIFSALGMDEQHDDEKLVQSLATALHQCLRDNRELFQCFLS